MSIERRSRPLPGGANSEQRLRVTGNVAWLEHRKTELYLPDVVIRHRLRQNLPHVRTLLFKQHSHVFFCEDFFV